MGAEDEPEYLYVVHAQLLSEDPEMLRSWRQWYEEQHFPNLLSVPGFVSAERYVDADDPSRSVAVYGIESPAVFDEPRYAEVTGWGRWASHIGPWKRGIYRRVGDLPTHPDSTS